MIRTRQGQPDDGNRANVEYAASETDEGEE